MSNPYQLRFDIWQEAKQGLMDAYYSDYEVWNNWQFDPSAKGDCPIKSKPAFPTNAEIRTEAEKIYDFVQQKD